MTRELLLLRHGKSDWSVAVDDFQRPLKGRGIRGAQQIGLWLLQHELVPDSIISSPAERAMATAIRCANAMGLGEKMIQAEEDLYLADEDALLSIAHNSGNASERLMLVGHNPGMEDFARDLAKHPIPTPDDGKLMPTACLAIFSVQGEWKALMPGQAELQGFVRAATLPTQFPYPTAAAQELRDRPAYYYTQSGVLPYRVVAGRLEILLIRSRKGKHWVVPKGIVDLGLSPEESARKEAREEAGIEGQVSAQAIGKYRYRKWGGSCTVTVFPMQVRRELDASEWPERQRGRRWVEAKTAASMLKQKQLAPMIKALERLLKK